MRLASILGALALLLSGCEVCGLIDQEVFVAADDPDLGALVASCRDRAPGAASAACAPDQRMPASIPCACRPLCERVYAIVDPDPGRAPLTECSLGVDGQGRARVEIVYRSVCK